MKNPIKLESKVVELLLPRLQDEFDAFAFYRSASNWCADKGFVHASKFFSEESQSELEHAKGIEKYLTGWNIVPELPTIDKPILKFGGLVDIIEQSYAIEYDLYEQYEKTSMKIFQVPDLCTFDFLQKYREIQTKSVAEYAEILNQLELIDSKDKFQLYYFEKRIFE